MTRLTTVATLILLVALPLGGQTVQYDTNTLTALPTAASLSTYRPGNTFTGLTGGSSITRITAHVLPGSGPNWFWQIKQSASAAGLLAQPSFPLPGAPGLTIFTLAPPVVFTGNRVFVAPSTAYANGVGIDTNSGGFGFHARPTNTAALLTYGGNPFNFILRITGPGLPVELVNFSIE